MTKCVPGHLNGTVVSTLIPFEAYGICAIKNKSFVVVEIIQLEDSLKEDPVYGQVVNVPANIN